MRDGIAAGDLRLTLIGVFLALALAGCGGSGGNGNSGGGGGDDGGGDGGGGGGGGVATPPSLPSATRSSAPSYVTATTAGWGVVPLLTAGDEPDAATYPMVGKPDGLGALAGKVAANGAVTDTGRYLTVLMNHELPADRGVARAHGAPGAFVSQWTVDRETLRVVEGRDLITRTLQYASGSWHDSAATLDRLCSADLPAAGALFNPQSGKGYDGSLFLNGEEILDGRAFATVVTGSEHGTAYELPHLGRYAHENVLVHPDTDDTTLVVSLDDSAGGQVYVYVGTKSSSGNPVEKAGLHGGKLYGVKVVDGGANYGGAAAPLENQGAIEGTFELVEVTDMALRSGAELQTVSVERGVTGFARPEDGHWDSQDPNAFYWVTTGAQLAGAQQTARLYRLRFNSITQPTGGTIELVLDSGNVTGMDGLKADGFDNVTVNGRGDVVIQEDRGGGDIAKIWLVDASTGTAAQIFESDRSRFLAGGTHFLTTDEEHSGVIEVTGLVAGTSWYEAGRRYYLGTTQAHTARGPEIVEDGQLYLFGSPR
jgi:hypothetical protein